MPHGKKAVTKQSTAGNNLSFSRSKLVDYLSFLRLRAERKRKRAAQNAKKIEAARSLVGSSDSQNFVGGDSSNPVIVEEDPEETNDDVVNELNSDPATESSGDNELLLFSGPPLSRTRIITLPKFLSSLSESESSKNGIGFKCIPTLTPKTPTVASTLAADPITSAGKISSSLEPFNFSNLSVTSIVLEKNRKEKGDSAATPPAPSSKKKFNLSKFSTPSFCSNLFEYCTKPSSFSEGGDGKTGISNSKRIPFGSGLSRRSPNTSPLGNFPPPASSSPLSGAAALDPHASLAGGNPLTGLSHTSDVDKAPSALGTAYSCSMKEIHKFSDPLLNTLAWGNSIRYGEAVKLCFPKPSSLLGDENSNNPLIYGTIGNLPVYRLDSGHFVLGQTETFSEQSKYAPMMRNISPNFVPSAPPPLEPSIQANTFRSVSSPPMDSVTLSPPKDSIPSPASIIKISTIKPLTDLTEMDSHIVTETIAHISGTISAWRQSREEQLSDTINKTFTAYVFSAFSPYNGQIAYDWSIAMSGNPTWTEALSFISRLDSTTESTKHHRAVQQVLTKIAKFVVDGSFNAVSTAQSINVLTSNPLTTPETRSQMFFESLAYYTTRESLTPYESGCLAKIMVDSINISRDEKLPLSASAMVETATKFQAQISHFEIITDTRAKAKARFDNLLSSSDSAAVLKITEDANSTLSSFPSTHSSRAKRTSGPVATFGSSPALRPGSKRGSESTFDSQSKVSQNNRARAGMKRERGNNSSSGTPPNSTKPKFDPISNSGNDRRVKLIRLEAGPTRWSTVNDQTKNRYGCDKDGFLVCSSFATRNQCSRALCGFSHHECVDKNPNYTPRVWPSPSSSQSTN